MKSRINVVTAFAALWGLAMSLTLGAQELHVTPNYRSTYIDSGIHTGGEGSDEPWHLVEECENEDAKEIRQTMAKRLGVEEERMEAMAILFEGIEEWTTQDVRNIGILHKRLYRLRKKHRDNI